MKVFLALRLYKRESAVVEQVCSTYEKARQYIIDKHGFGVDDEENYSSGDGFEQNDPACIDEWEVDRNVPYRRRTGTHSVSVLPQDR